MDLHPNYQYVLYKIRSLSPPEGVILDYGCGKGVVVEEGLRRGYAMYGCELFGEGSGVNIRDKLHQKGLLGGKVREIKNGLIPFSDDKFDLIVSNQVFEHVPELDPVIGEITKVLKPSGRLLTIFPVKECFRDHAGTLFAHWFPVNSKAQYYNLLFFRSLGFGRLKKGKDRDTPEKWASFFVKWLSENTFYRPKQDIDLLLSRYFHNVQHMEEDYLGYRLKLRNLRSIAYIGDLKIGKILFQWLGIHVASSVILCENKRD